jgi:hypothetical protein
MLPTVLLYFLQLEAFSKIYAEIWEWNFFQLLILLLNVLTGISALQKAKCSVTELLSHSMRRLRTIFGNFLFF